MKNKTHWCKQRYCNITQFQDTLVKKILASTNVLVCGTRLGAKAKLNFLKTLCVLSVVLALICILTFKHCQSLEVTQGVLESRVPCCVLRGVERAKEQHYFEENLINF